MPFHKTSFLTSCSIKYCMVKSFWMNNISWLLRSSALCQKFMRNLSGPTIGNYQGFTWQVLSGKAALPTPVWCTTSVLQALKGVGVKSTGLPGRRALMHICLCILDATIFKSPNREHEDTLSPLWLSYQYFSILTPSLLSLNPQSLAPGSIK